MTSPDALASLIDHLPDIVWTLDVSSDPASYTFISPAAERVLGEPVETFLSDVTHFFRRVHHRDLGFLELGPQGRGPDETGRTRVRYFKPDGSMIWLEVHWSWIYGPDGKLSLVHGMTRDVTEAADTEERLRRSERGMRNAQAMSNVGTFEWDPVRGWSIWSPEHYHLFGHEPPDEVSDAQWIFQSTVLPEDFVKVSRAWQVALERKELFQVDYRILRSDGELRWIESRGGPRFDDDGRLLGVDGTVRDVTVERRAQEALRRFVADAAHELRTPVAAIVGAVDLLVRRRDGLDSTQLEVLLDVLGRQSQRLHDIHLSLLDLMAFEHDVDRVETAPLDLDPLVDEVLRSVAAPAGVEVARTGVALVVLAEPARVKRMVTELLRNAYEHGGPHVRITTELVDDMVELAVADDGPGIAHEQQPHLFLPFSRGAKPSGAGSGVGLAVVERLAAVLGATVSYDAPDAGSRFVVRLPGWLSSDRAPAEVGAP